jgi:hypothetical protein
VGSVGLAFELWEGGIGHIVHAQQRVRKELDGIAFIELCAEGSGMVEITVEATKAELVTFIFQTYTIERNAIIRVVGEIHGRGTKMEGEFFPNRPEVDGESWPGKGELFGTHVDQVDTYRDTDAIDIKCHIGVGRGRKRGIVMQVGIIPRRRELGSNRTGNGQRVDYGLTVLRP